MIYTLTLNPAIDYVVQVDNFQTGQINHINKEQIFYGGKGINVSHALKELNVESTALGFISGFTGTAIEKGVRKIGFRSDFVHLENGITRINVKLKSAEETEINGEGPVIQHNDVLRLLEKLNQLVDHDILVLAGSVPKTMTENIYEIIMEKLQGKKVKVIADTRKHLLFPMLKYHPFLVKPNHHELGEMFGVTLTEKDDIIFYAKKLKKLGAENVLVSMAEKGAVLLTKQDQVLEQPAPKGKIKNSVGAGDSMVAGFLAGYLKNFDYKEALALGIAAGSASAFSNDIATREEILKLYEQIWS